jgi:hypothetical protein
MRCAARAVEKGVHKVIEKLKQDGDVWIDTDGVSWSSPVNYLCVGVLPSCGCGNPESIAVYVRDMLRKHVKQTGSEGYSCWNETKYEDLPVMFFLSWADREGYIEHGSTIRCSWMTPKGDELLRDIDSLIE